jgi:UDP-glucose 4-epimerase
VNVLILGGGFIGSNLAKMLIENNHNVKIFSRSPVNFPDVIQRTSLLEDISSHLDFFEGVDIIVHALSSSVPFTSMHDYAVDVEENLIHNLKLIKAINESGIKKIIFLSSGGAVYGNPKTEIVDETHATNPISSYGIVKLSLEKYFQLNDHIYGTQTTIIRPSNIYGPGQKTNKPQGIIGHIADRIKNNYPLTIWGDGKGRKDYLHIDDFSDALLRVIESKCFSSSVYNISAHDPYSVVELIKTIENFTGSTLTVHYDDPKLYDVQTILLQSDKFRKAFKWENVKNLKSSLGELMPKN